MTMETLEKAIKAQPFRPFDLHLADGRTIPVPHPEFIAFNPRGRVALVLDEHDGAEYIDLLLVVSLSVEGRPATHSNRD